MPANLLQGFIAGVPPWPVGSSAPEADGTIPASGVIFGGGLFTTAFIDTAHAIGEWTSPDGVVWTRSYTGPTLNLGPGFSAVWQFSADLSAVAYLDPSVSSRSSLSIRLSSEAWATQHNFTVAGFQSFAQLQMWRRTTGRYAIAILCAQISTSHDSIVATEFDPVAGTFVPGILMTGVENVLSLVSTGLNATDRLTVCYKKAGSFASVDLSSVNAVGSEAAMPGATDFVGGQVIPITSALMAVAITFTDGTGLGLYDGTSWTAVDNLDGSTSGGGTGVGSGLGFDGTNVYLVYEKPTADFIRSGSVPVASVANAAAWNFSTVLNLTVPSAIVPTLVAPYSLTGLVLTLANGSITSLMQLTDGNNATFENFYGVAAAPPVSTGPRPTAGGGGGAVSGSGGFAAGFSTIGGRARCCTNGHHTLIMRAAELVRRRDAMRKAWPYLHEFPARPTIPVNWIQAAASPAVNATAVVDAYTVPGGVRFFLSAVLQDVDASGFLPGAALWTVDRNAASGAQGQKIQGLINVPVPLGSVNSGRFWEFERPYEFQPFDTIRSTVVNVSLGVGPPNFFISGFFGWLAEI